MASAACHCVGHELQTMGGLRVGEDGEGSGEKGVERREWGEGRRRNWGELGRI